MNEESRCPDCDRPSWNPPEEVYCVDCATGHGPREMHEKVSRFRRERDALLESGAKMNRALAATRSALRRGEHMTTEIDGLGADAMIDWNETVTKINGEEQHD